MTELVMAPLRFIFLSLISTGYLDLPSPYRPLSFCIGLFQTDLVAEIWVGKFALCCKEDRQGRVFLFAVCIFFFFLDKRLRVFIDICLMKVTLSKRTIQYFKDKLWTWLFFKWPFFLMWQHRRKGFCFYI